MSPEGDSPRVMFFMGSFPTRPGLTMTAIVALGMLGCIPWQLTPRALAAVTPPPSESVSGAATERQPDSGYRETPSRDAAPVADGALRYHPRAGETYLYAVKIETTEADYTETLSGNASYHCRAADENGMILTCSGGLAPLRRAVQGGGAVGSPFLRLHAFGFGALGFPRPFAGPNEIKIDGQGHLLSTSGETPLPRALGDLSQLIVETLPADDGAAWQVQNGCVIVLHEEHGSHPFGRSEQRNLPASETLSYTLGQTTGDLVQIDKRYILQTNERAFGAPTLQIAGEGRMAFDRKLGMPRTLAFKLTLTSQPDRTTTTRIPVTVTYRLLEGEEREKALHPPVPVPPVPPVLKPLTDSEVETALTDLQATDGFKVIGAANKLAGAQPGGNRRAVERALIGALDHKDGFARQSVVKALGTWGGRDSVPPLIRRLDDESFAVRWAVIDVLGARGDVRAAEPLAKWLEKDRGFASNALRKMGAIAAPAVARQLGTKDWGVRIDVCRLLKDIGTKREIPALQAVTHDENRLVADAASEAIKTIQQRADTKGAR